MSPTLDLALTNAQRSLLFVLIVGFWVLVAGANTDRAESRCNTNAECLRRRLPLLRPKRLHKQAPSAERRAFDPIVRNPECSSSSPVYNLQQLLAGVYEITVTGAQGGGNVRGIQFTAGGSAAKLVATYNFTNPITLDLLVGCQGGTGGGAPGAGGGGSFVAVGTIPLIVAGGGGGSYNSQRGGDASSTYSTIGNPSPNNVPVQTNDRQGGNAAQGSAVQAGGGGGGFSGNGQDAPGAPVNGGAGGKSFLNGGNGGSGGSIDGGTGGGGAASFNGAGGGGGYTGGAGGYNSGSQFTSGIGGAGGSYYDPGSSSISSIAIFQAFDYSVSTTAGNGQIVIQRIS